MLNLNERDNKQENHKRIKCGNNFCSNLCRYRYYMLTLQKPWRVLKDPECRLAGPFGTMAQEPWHPERARHNAEPVSWSSSTMGKCTPLQAWQPDQWRASITERNFSLLTDELLRDVRKHWYDLGFKINTSTTFCNIDFVFEKYIKRLPSAFKKCLCHRTFKWFF